MLLHLGYRRSLAITPALVDHEQDGIVYVYDSPGE